MNPDLGMGLCLALFALALPVIVTLMCLSIAWVYTDAKERRQVPWLPALLVYFTWPMGLLVWWLARPEKTDARSSEAGENRP